MTNKRRISLTTTSPLFTDFFKPSHSVLNTLEAFEDLFFKDIPDVTLPHDIIKIMKNDSTKYRIDLAVAGYPKDSLKVTEEQSNLHGYKRVKVFSIIEKNDNFNKEDYIGAETQKEIPIVKKLSKRNFTIAWDVPKSFKIESVKMDNGILNILLDATETEVDIKTFDIE